MDCSYKNVYCISLYSIENVIIMIQHGINHPIRELWESGGRRKGVGEWMGGSYYKQRAIDLTFTAFAKTENNTRPKLLNIVKVSIIIIIISLRVCVSNFILLQFPHYSLSWAIVFERRSIIYLIVCYASDVLARESNYVGCVMLIYFHKIHQPHTVVVWKNTHYAIFLNIDYQLKSCYKQFEKKYDDNEIKIQKNEAIRKFRLICVNIWSKVNLKYFENFKFKLEIVIILGFV